MYLNIFDRPKNLACTVRCCCHKFVAVSGDQRKTGGPVKREIIRFKDTVLRHVCFGVDGLRLLVCSCVGHLHDLRHVSVPE